MSQFQKTGGQNEKIKKIKNYVRIYEYLFFNIVCFFFYLNNKEASQLTKYAGV